MYNPNYEVNKYHNTKVFEAAEADRVLKSLRSEKKHPLKDRLMLNSGRALVAAGKYLQKRAVDRKAIVSPSS
jgi:hypothetical protein